MPNPNMQDQSISAEERRNFGVVCLALTCVFIVHSMLLVTVPVHAVDLGASPLLLGVIFSAPYLLPLIVAIPFGTLVTRHGGRVSMLSGASLMIFGLVTILVVPGYPGLIIGQLSFGLAQLQMVLAAQTIISTLGTGPKLESYFGWYTTWLSGGQIVGPLIAGGLIHAVGTTASSFAAMLVIACCSLVMALLLTGQAKQGKSVQWSSTGFRAQGSLFCKSPAVQISIAVTAAATFAMIIHGNYLPVLLENMLVTPTTIGILISLRAVAAMVIRPVIAKVIALMGGRGIALLVSILSMALGMLFLGGTDNLILIGFFSILIGLGSGVCQPLSIVVLSESVDSTQRAGALGMRLMANRGINFLAPLLFGLMLEIGGFALSFALTGAVLLLATMLVLFLLRADNLPAA
ncbi:MFS transporter [Marinobacter sp. GN3S48]|uniref:MFS transporter n=1 Tax=Marinobacter sp. GN3S48 TaxID=3382302 RepID=UPI00387B4C3C